MGPQDPTNLQTNKGCIPSNIVRKRTIRELANILTDECLESWKRVYAHDLETHASELEVEGKVVVDLIKRFEEMEVSGNRPNDLDLVYCAYKLNDPCALEEWNAKKDTWFYSLAANDKLSDENVRTMMDKVWYWEEPDLFDQGIFRRFLSQNSSMLAQLNETSSSTESRIHPHNASQWLKSSFYHKEAVTKDIIAKFLSQYTDSIQEFVQKADLPHWKPSAPFDCSVDLGVPAYPNSDKPCLLLHGIRKDRTNIEHIFLRSNSTLLVNASGCGKSRLAILGLSRYWGFYLVCIYESGLADTIPLGSQDLSHLLSKQIPSHYAFTAPSILKGLERTRRDVSLSRNHTIAERHCRVVMLARLLIFRLFLQACHEDARRSSQDFKDQESLYRYRWLLLQLYPCLLKPTQRDIFLDLTKALARINPDDVDNLVQDEMLQILEMIDGARIYCVVDEAQFAGRELYGSFASKQKNLSDDHPVYRPILSAMFHGWDGLGLWGMLYIVTGTGISRDMMIDALNSSSHKEGSLRVCYHTGGFDDPAKQWDYVKQFLPIDYQQSKLGQALRWRIWWWLRGRYRYTTAFIEALLVNGYDHAHHLLNEYVEYSGFVSPSDGKLCLMNEEASHGPRKSFPFSHCIVDYGQLFKYERLCNRLEDVFYKIFLRSQNGTNQSAIHMLTSEKVEFINHAITGVQNPWPLSLPRSEQAELIRHGIARVQGERETHVETDDRLDNVTINEPITLGLAMNFLKAAKGGVLSWAFEGENQAGDIGGTCNGFENLIGVYLATKFANWCPLSDVFDFIDIGDDKLEPLRTAHARLISRHPDPEQPEFPTPMDNDGPPYAHVSYRDSFMVMDKQNYNYQRLLDGRRKHYRKQTEGLYSCGPTVELGFCGGNDMGMFDTWMQGETGIPICFPPRDAGPDLLLCLELKSDDPSFDGKCMWLAAQAKRHKKFFPSDFMRALRTISPSGMYMYEPREKAEENLDETNDQMGDAPMVPLNEHEAQRPSSGKQEPQSKQIKQTTGKLPTPSKGRKKMEHIDILSRCKDRKVRVSGKDHIGREYMCSRFSKLRNSLSLRSLGVLETEHDFTVLRVLAIHPAEVPQLSAHHKADSLITKDRHPIATLKALELYASDERRVDLDSAFHHRNKRRKTETFPAQRYKAAFSMEAGQSDGGSDMDEY